MEKIAVLTDSNSGITQKEGEALGIKVIPMPFTIDNVEFLEDINLTQEQFYEKLTTGANVSTSQPSIGFVTSVWDELLKDYDKIIYIPMSSGLSKSCEAAALAANAEYLKFSEFETKNSTSNTIDEEFQFINCNIVLR